MTYDQTTVLLKIYKTDHDSQVSFISIYFRDWINTIQSYLTIVHLNK